jgi:hypothetical protein
MGFCSWGEWLRNDVSGVWGILPKVRLLRFEPEFREIEADNNLKSVKTPNRLFQFLILAHAASTIPEPSRDDEKILIRCGEEGLLPALNALYRQCILRAQEKDENEYLIRIVAENKNGRSSVRLHWIVDSPE